MSRSSGGLPYHNKVALVTGGGSGIGRSVAFGLARGGAQVTVADINGDSAEQVAHELRSYDVPSSAIQVDVSDESSITNMAMHISEDHGPVDILVHCAGARQQTKYPAWELPVSTWDALMDLNLRGTYLVCRAIVPQMLQKGFGRIVTVSSITGKVARLGWAGYCTSKAAVIQFTRVLALDLARTGITANTICPGATETGFLQQAIANEGQSVVQKKVQGDASEFRAGIPVGHLAQPEDPAAAALFLVTDAARHVTGQTLFIDGGESLV